MEVQNLLFSVLQLYPFYLECTIVYNLYCLQTKLREGNVFTPVCHSVHGGGVSQQALGQRGVTGGVHPTHALVTHTHTPSSQQTGGRHLTGMLSCLESRLS